MGAAGGGGAGGGGVALGLKLVVRLDAVAAIVQQAKALFQVEDEGAVIPLARREGGVIGSTVTLKDPRGNAVAMPS